MTTKRRPKPPPAPLEQVDSTDYSYSSKATGQTIKIKDVPVSRRLPDGEPLLSIVTAKHLETLVNAALRSGLSIVETDFTATANTKPPSALDPQSTLSRMLEESEAAAYDVLHGIAIVRQAGNDNKAILFSAVSLMHQKSKSMLRQLEKETDTPSNKPRPAKLEK